MVAVSERHRWRLGLFGAGMFLAGVVFTLVTELFVLGRRGAEAPSQEEQGAAPFSLGLTAPVHLLSYRHADGLPAYCRRSAILETLAAQANARGCQASATDLGGMPTRIITCALAPAERGAAPACPSSYVAQVWQERWPGSTEDYELDMYARVHTTCARERDFSTFQAPDEITAAAEHQNDEVVRLFDACQSTGGSP